MNPDSLLEILRSVASGERSVQDAAARLDEAAFTEVTAAGRVEARVDHDRASRCGFPEVIFCQGKTAEQVASIAAELLTRADVVLATRASEEQAAAFSAAIPDAHHDPLARSKPFGVDLVEPGVGRHVDVNGRT